jgi:hypothetical protein
VPGLHRRHCARDDLQPVDQGLIAALVIKVSSGAAETIANSQQKFLIGTALLEAQRKNVINAPQLKSVFIDFR